MYLHEDPVNFKNLIEQTAAATGRSAVIIEKDYYITLILRSLSEKLNGVVFKGGTSLSKGYHAINRFSEDIDITFDKYIGEAKRKKLKYAVLEKIGNELGMPILNFNETQSDRDYNAYFFAYRSVLELADDRILSSVKLEVALGSYAFPTQKMLIGNYIGDYLHSRHRSDIAGQFCLESFEMNLQALERTYIDKIFAICDYYLTGHSSRYSRHIYDLFKLTPRISYDDNFKNLFQEVRAHRAKMKICPSAKDSVNLPDILDELCRTDFYKEDYQSITTYFTDDPVEYQDVVTCIQKIADFLRTQQGTPTPIADSSAMS